MRFNTTVNTHIDNPHTVCTRTLSHSHSHSLTLHTITDDSKELARVGPGQCFGEMALLSGDTRAANVMALDNSEVRCC